MIKRKKILIILPTPFKSDTQLDVYLRVKAISLANTDADITLITFPYGENIFMKNLKIIRFPEFKLFREIMPGQYIKTLIYSFFLFMKLIFSKKEDFDITFAFLTSYFYAHLFRKKFNCKIVSTVFGNVSEEIENWNIHYLYIFKNLIKKFDVYINNKNDKIVFGNELVVKEFLENGLNMEKVILIPYAYEENKVKISYTKNNSLTILYAGIFHEIQNLSLVIDAAVILKDKIMDLNFTLIGATDVEYKNYIDIISRNNISGLVDIKKRINHNLLNEYFLKADALISTRIDGISFPMKLFEYMSYGKCILAANRPIHTGVLDESTACLFEPTSEDLAKKILYLKNNPFKIVEYGRNAYRLYKEKYSFDRMTNDYKKLSDNIIN